MYTWELMCLEGTHMAVDSGMYVVCDIHISFTVLAIYIVVHVYNPIFFIVNALNGKLPS
jgi:hypothetical protein